MFVYLNALFVGLLVLSNILGVKLFSIGDFVLPAAVIVYVITYLITDVIGEVYGKEAAKKTVRAGFFTQIIALLFLFIAIELPAAPLFGNQQEFETILGGSLRVILASTLSYLASQHFDVYFFHRLKRKHGMEKLWLRNNVSTISSQFIDTSLFITIAFWGTVPATALLSMMATQYIFKLIVALLDTPITYLFVKIARKEKESSDLPISA